MKAVACEPPSEGAPLSRRSAADIHRLVVERGIRQLAAGVLGSSHRGQKSIDRLERRWPNLRLIHLPTHASWLNQIEIVFSITQRKLLQPNRFDSTAELAQALNDFESYYNKNAEPFDWNFTSSDLAELLARLASHEPALALAA